MFKTLERTLRRKVFNKFKKKLRPHTLTHTPEVLVPPVTEEGVDTPNSLGNTRPSLKTKVPINRIPNPWAAVQAYKTIDAHAPVKDYQADYEKYGVVLIKNLLTQEESADFLEKARKLTGICDDDYLPILRNERTTHISPGSMHRNPEFWPLLVHPKLVEIVGSLFGEPPRYVGSDSIFLHYSSIGFHRDTDVLDESCSWYNRDYKYKYMKLMFYFNDDGRQNNRLGIQPFSHFKTPVQPPGWTGTQEELEMFPIWLDVSPTDCLIFDPRIKHSGDTLNGPKYAMTFAYSVESEYTLDAVFLGRTGGQLEGYNEYSPEFLAYLKAHGVMLNEMENQELFKQYEVISKDYIEERIHWLNEHEKISKERKDLLLKRLHAGEPLTPEGETRDIIYF